MNVAVRDLKNRLSEYLRRVQSGEEVVITSRGRPIAQLGPLRPVISESSSDLRKRLAAIPWITAGNGDRPQGARESIRIDAGEKTLADIVLQDRQ